MTTPTVPADSPLRSWRWLRWGLAGAPFLLVLVYQIATSAFLCDDAFILFRYARNLVNGHGLVFNPGERVEGFVDLLWVLEIAGLWWLGVRPEIGAPALSLVMTAGTLALVLANAARATPAAQRPLIAWIAFGLVASSASFAVWSTGGLETRQFTFLLLLGCLVLSGTPSRKRRLLAASCVFGLAELTRPEGLLLFASAFAWRVAQDRLHGELRVSRLFCLAAPFASIVGAQFLWRHDYYGEWLPNPYYAKHVMPWYDLGFAYLAAAAIELGAWLWVPLAAIAAVRSSNQRDLTPALPFVLVFGHALYLLRIGGDHFEYRPLDFYLPLLAVPAATGLVHTVEWLVAALRVDAAARAAWAGRLAIAAGLPVLVYSQGIGIASLAVALRHQEPLEGLRERTRLDASSAPPLRWAPGLLPLCDILEPLREKLYRHLVAVPAQVHRMLAKDLVASFAPCERLPTGVFPADAVAAANTVGVMPFYLDELRVIDVHGLTDATVARTAVRHDNQQRRMAHDRHASPAYLRQRGVNVSIGRACGSEAQALADADFAVRIEDGLWLPLLAVDREYPQRSFAAERLAARHRVDSHEAAGNHLLLDGRAYDGVQLLATFAEPAAAADWQCTGDVSTRPVRELLMGGVGPGQLTTQGADDAAAGQGTARSAPFVAAAGTHLVMFLAGERALGLGVTLCRGDQVLRVFGPADPKRLQPVVLALDAWAGEMLHLEVHDRGPGWLALDHVLLAREGDDPRAALSHAWSAAPPPPAAGVQIAPLRSVDGKTASGPTVLTVTNPLPCPVELTVELVEGPLDATLLCGPWTLDQGHQALRTIPPGTTARMHAWLRIGEAAAVERQPFLVRLHVHPDRPVNVATIAPVRLDLPLVWHDRN